MARRRRERPEWNWPSWRYGPEGESAIFNCEEDVPIGWAKSPGGFPDPLVQRHPLRLNRDDLINALKEKGVDIDPTWGSAHLKKVLDE